MPEGLIDMGDMEVIFSVTDALGIHRESVSVELAKEDPGSIGLGERDTIQITVPESKTIQEFSRDLEAELMKMGYAPQEPEDAEEVVQNTGLSYIYLERSVKKSDPIKNPAAFSRTIASRKIVDLFRRERPDRWKPLSSELLALLLQKQAPELECEKKIQKLWACIARLPEVYRGAIYLRYFEAYTYDQISKRLGINKERVKYLLQRGRELLRKWLDE